VEFFEKMDLKFQLKNFEECSIVGLGGRKKVNECELENIVVAILDGCFIESLNLLNFTDLHNTDMLKEMEDFQYLKLKIFQKAIYSTSKNKLFNF
jgi:hypothetical protein